MGGWPTGGAKTGERRKPRPTLTTGSGMHTCRCHATFSTGRPTTGGRTANTGQEICIDILFMATTLLVYSVHIQIYLQSGRNSFCTQIDFFIFLIEICSFSSFQWFPFHGNYRTVLATHLQPHHTCSGKVQHWLRHIYNYLSPYQHLYHTGSSARFCIVHIIHTWVSEWWL